jgi:hypothetical protein
MNVMGILALEILWPSHIAATGRATKKLLSLPSAVPQAEIGHLISEGHLEQKIHLRQFRM